MPYGKQCHTENKEGHPFTGQKVQPAEKEEKYAESCRESSGGERRGADSRRVCPYIATQAITFEYDTRLSQNFAGESRTRSKSIHIW